jgi:hypothetical protein
MNRSEAVQLCRLVKACCPSQQLDPFTPDAWMLILGGHPYPDAKDAVAELASMPLEPGKSRYIEPGHIIGGIQRIRQRRLEAVAMPEPPAALSASEYIDWQRQTREAIASGAWTPTPRPSIANPARVAALLAEASPKEPE